MSEVTVTIKNPTRSRKWGFGYETRPYRNSTSIMPPTKPDHTGTLRQVREAIENDRTFASFRSGGTFYSTRWFYDGKVIAGVSGATWGDSFSDWLHELDFEQHEGRTVDSVTLTLEQQHA